MFTLFHVALSLIGIAAGIPAAYGMLRGPRADGWTATFLWTTLATSVTGFLFPIEKLTPGLVLGVLSLIALGFAMPALYRYRLAGSWRRTYVISAMIAFYFNVFVLGAQLFDKVPVLKANAQPFFAVEQLIVLVLFVWLGTVASLRAGTRVRILTAGSTV